MTTDRALAERCLAELRHSEVQLLRPPLLAETPLTGLEMLPVRLVTLLALRSGAWVTRPVRLVALLALQLLAPPPLSPAGWVTPVLHCLLVQAMFAVLLAGHSARLPELPVVVPQEQAFFVRTTMTMMAQDSLAA